jgi:hypothetical protein
MIDLPAAGVGRREAHPAKGLEAAAAVVRGFLLGQPDGQFFSCAHPTLQVVRRGVTWAGPE